MTINKDEFIAYITKSNDLFTNKIIEIIKDDAYWLGELGIQEADIKIDKSISDFIFSLLNGSFHFTRIVKVHLISISYNCTIFTFKGPPTSQTQLRERRHMHDLWNLNYGPTLQLVRFGYRKIGSAYQKWCLDMKSRVWL